MAHVILDAGCGTGKAIYDLRQHWVNRLPNLNVTLLGIESDKSRHGQAADLLGPANVLWSAIEDATIDQPVSLLWYNPPYDRIRGAGRSEAALFNRVKEWPARGTGLLLMIVPDYVLADANVGLINDNQGNRNESDSSLDEAGDIMDAMDNYIKARITTYPKTSGFLPLSEIAEILSKALGKTFTPRGVGKILKGHCEAGRLPRLTYQKTNEARGYNVIAPEADVIGAGEGI